MFFKPKKSKEIYDLVIAHRGFHISCPENTYTSFKEAIKNNMAIETDIRITKDNILVCFHDRHLKRLLGIKGKIKYLTYDDLNKLNIKGSYEKVPRLIDVLNMVDGKVVLLLEIKGNINKEVKKQLCMLLNKYSGKVYFHVKNIITYFYYRKIFKNRIFFVLNPLRKRFRFV